MSDERPRVVIGLTPIAEKAIEGLLFANEDPPFVLVASVAQADELQREGTETGAAAVLLSPQLQGLSPGHCSRLRARGARLVGLALDQVDRDALSSLGVDTVIDDTATSAQLASALNADHEQRPAVSTRAEPLRAPQASNGGAVIGVIGTKGAPGASECAASLATLTDSRWATLLVELDARGGDLDVRLGMDGQRGSVLGVARAAVAGQQNLAELLERWIVTADGWPHVLLAPRDSDELASELGRPGAVDATLEALSAEYPVVVCDAGSHLGGPHDDGPAARMHADAVVCAGVVVLVVGSREGQLRHGLAQLDRLLDRHGIAPQRVRIAINAVGAPGSPSRPAIEDALTEPLAQRGLTVDAWLPFDKRALARARRLGSPLAAARHRGPYARALAKLAGELFLPDRPAPQARKQRLHAPAAAERDDNEVALPWRT